VENSDRITDPMYRAPHSNQWKKISCDWALTEIAKRLETSREASFEAKNAKGQIVNRTAGIASVGSAALDNEECWIYQALIRAMGVTYIEHQARI
jgi:formate dehydrogenase major subunit